MLVIQYLTCSRTVSDEILSLLVDDMSAVELLKGRTDLAAILFFDIRGFSSAAEKMQPQELLQALNEHLQLITQVAYRMCVSYSDRCSKCK